MRNARFNKAYLDYIHSEAWRDVSEKRKAIDDNKCCICGTENNLEVHHLNYDNLGHEDINEDLVTLCSDCHKEVHQAKDDFVKGSVAAVIILNAVEKYGGFQAMINQFGIFSTEAVSMLTDAYKKSLKMVYIPIPTGGAITVPYCECYCEKDIRKIGRLVGFDYDKEVLFGAAHKLYKIAAENGAYIGT